MAGAAPGGAPAEAQPAGVYRPRRARASPPYRLIEEHSPAFTTVYDERFAPRWGPWRRVVPEVVKKFLACGIQHGFARVRCASCRQEYLLAFSCKSRYFCPSPARGPLPRRGPVRQFTGDALAKLYSTSGRPEEAARVSGRP